MNKGLKSLYGVNPCLSAGFKGIIFDNDIITPSRTPPDDSRSLRQNLPKRRAHSLLRQVLKPLAAILLGTFLIGGQTAYAVQKKIA